MGVQFNGSAHRSSGERGRRSAEPRTAAGAAAVAGATAAATCRTGGGIAEAITRIAGSSAWFDRGFVTYSNAAKVDMLGVPETTLARQGAEAQLLVVGGQFGAALDSYAKATPLGQHTAPRTLEELLRDPRYPQPMRHLRKLSDDPLTGEATWGLVRDSQGYITGIYSLASGKPIKQFGFAIEEAHFQNSEIYAQWIFRGMSSMRAMPVSPLQPMPLGHVPL